jgi:hypothetical protein
MADITNQMHDLSMDYASISHQGKYPAVLTINCSRYRHFCYILCQPYLSTIAETPSVGDDFRMGTGKIAAYGMSALLIILLIVVAAPAALTQGPGGAANNTTAGNASLSASGFDNSSITGKTGANATVPAKIPPADNRTGATAAGDSAAPDSLSESQGSPAWDPWGWGGLGQNGILAPGACGCTRPGKAHGALWSYWQPSPL